MADGGSAPTGGAERVQQGRCGEHRRARSVSVFCVLPATESHQTEPRRTKPSRASPDRAAPSRADPSRSESRGVTHFQAREVEGTAEKGCSCCRGGAEAVTPPRAGRVRPYCEPSETERRPRAVCVLCVRLDYAPFISVTYGFINCGRNVSTTPRGPWGLEEAAWLDYCVLCFVWVHAGFPMVNRFYRGVLRIVYCQEPNSA